LALALLLMGAAQGAKAEDLAMHLLSPVFENGGFIPARYTCEGEDISPPLYWSGAPAGTKSFALIAEDPDAPDPRAPRMTWDHWVVHNIPADAEELPEGASGRAMPPGAVEGVNSWKRTGYGGPCPPIGRHRYFFKLYALKRPLGDLDQPTKKQLLKAMQGLVIGEGVLIGTYQKR
jgi:Raf kinase inhibitor-like YbhB/YbcL family protein